MGENIQFRKLYKATNCFNSPTWPECYGDAMVSCANLLGHKLIDKEMFLSVFNVKSDLLNITKNDGATH